MTISRRTPFVPYRRATERSRILPGYLIVGAQRAGSTSLFSYLSSHPLVGAPTLKEVHFFDEHYAEGLAWYRRHMPSGRWRRSVSERTGRSPIVGEASPYYLFHPAVPARVIVALPAVRLIALLRDPVARAYSHYQHERAQGREPLPFLEALESEPARLAGEESRLLGDPSYRSPAHKNQSYASRGLYAEQLERWFDVFPREQILVLRSEDLFSEPARTYARVLEFLELEPFDGLDFEIMNRRSYPTLDPAARAWLRDRFREPNHRLRELLGSEFVWPDAGA